MHKMFGFIFLSLLYMEIVFHLSIFGFAGINPMLMIPAAVVVAGVETCLVGIFKKRQFNMIAMWVLQGINYLIFAAELVYYQIFKTPLLIQAAVTTGGTALKDFWQVALDGILQRTFSLILLAIPMIVAGVLIHKNVFKLKKFRKKVLLEALGFGGVGVLASIIIFVLGYSMNTEFYDEYQGMYAPEILIEKYGVVPLFERQMLGDALKEKELSLDALAVNGVTGNDQGTEQGTESGTETGPQIDTSPNVLNIDMDALLENGDDEIDKLTQIMSSVSPTNKNEYTGMFEGYNLIYLTAEAFSPYAVTEEFTPTLYKMLHSGIVVEDYYIPLWQTSTSDGEYVNLLGQIPDGQFSFERTAENAQPYALPKYFEKEGVKSYAYHNHSLSYYSRHLTHPNMGYDFKANKLGALTEEEWGSQIFDMENANMWPSSDYDMMVATVPEWINEDRFHAYYMTVSGHTVYNWVGNSMCKLNKPLVENMDISEEMQAYMACNYELERAMTYLIEELEKAGKLENTVIVLSADHYPYGFDDPQGVLEEYSGKDLSGLELYRNCLIMWNSEMETIEVEKTCSSMDLIPTLLNLFGFEYDSRLYPGKDMLSDAPSLVIFSDRSFITDTVIYNASTKTAESRTGEEVSDEYLESMKTYVRAMFQYSAGVLNHDYLKYIEDAVIQTN